MCDSQALPPVAKVAALPCAPDRATAAAEPRETHSQDGVWIETCDEWWDEDGEGEDECDSEGDHPQTASSWACEQCTFVNRATLSRADSSSCDICGSPQLCTCSTSSQSSHAAKRTRTDPISESNAYRDAT